MGSGADYTIPFLAFAIGYLVFIGLIMGMIGKTTQTYDYEGSEISVVGFTFDPIRSFSLSNILTNIGDLKAWNLLVFSPVIILIGFALFALLYPL